MTEKIFLCSQEELDEAGVIKVPHPTQSGITIMLIKKDDHCFAYRNICPHYSIQLDNAKGRFFTYQNRYIMCAHHSAMFEIETGLCVDGPCKNHSLVPENVVQENHKWYLCI
ncbi:Rieske (2Fe-2S) protein [Neisseria montereyensis]|uniref:Rieske 2Fe-2S domain-containing protein n=1 Tax=Neisseria montereyensis TaxID=2973938 RepID=A0ABT2FB90_9NEIS|nr:Rieske 2Fe-2S domain-containing protein [Neisseria montereyensis]